VGQGWNSDYLEGRFIAGKIISRLWKDINNTVIFLKMHLRWRNVRGDWQNFSTLLWTSRSGINFSDKNSHSLPLTRSDAQCHAVQTWRYLINILHDEGQCWSCLTNCTPKKMTRRIRFDYSIARSTLWYHSYLVASNRQDCWRKMSHWSIASA